MNKTDVLSRENSVALKGILAMIIVIHHIRNNITFLNGTVLGSILTPIAYLVVGLFFFLTGYGLCESFKSKPNYCEKMITNRILPFYADYLIFLLIYIIYDVCTGVKIGGVMLLKSFTFGGTLIQNGWYLQVALFIYIAFYIACKFSQNNEFKRNLILLCMFCVYIALCFLLKLKLIFYLRSFSGVILGYVWSLNKQRFNLFFFKRLYLTILISFVLFAGTFVAGRLITTVALKTILLMLSVCFFAIFVFCVLKIVPIKCKLTKFLGTISLEIYAIHSLFVSAFSKLAETKIGSAVYAVTVVAATILTAWLLNILIKKVNSALKKKLNSI